MGKIVQAAKVTHVPTMLLSEQPGRLHGKRQQAQSGALLVIVIFVKGAVNTDAGTERARPTPTRTSTKREPGLKPVERIENSINNTPKSWILNI